jgi:hypothetical protein
VRFFGARFGGAQCHRHDPPNGLLDDDPAERLLVNLIAAELRNGERAHSNGTRGVTRPSRIIQSNFELANGATNARRSISVRQAVGIAYRSLDAHLTRDRNTDTGD